MDTSKKCFSLVVSNCRRRVQASGFSPVNKLALFMMKGGEKLKHGTGVIGNNIRKCVFCEVL